MLSTSVEVIQQELVGVETVELASLDNAEDHSGQFAGPDSVMPIVVVATHDPQADQPFGPVVIHRDVGVGDKEDQTSPMTFHTDQDFLLGGEQALASGGSVFHSGYGRFEFNLSLLEQLRLVSDAQSGIVEGIELADFFDPTFGPGGQYWLLGVGFAEINKVTSLMAPAEGHPDQVTDGLIDPQPIGADDGQVIIENIGLVSNLRRLTCLGSTLASW